jgi:predicted transcriptional regulator
MSVNKDETMTEIDRRHAGAYFTKLEWAKEAHDFLEARLGSDWRDKYIVWDCAAGTGNLTREYDFGDLLLSTLDQDEVDIIENEGLNGDACVFQYDFLSCDPLPVDAKARLDAAVKAGKTLLFLINPPYANSADMKRKAKLKQGGLTGSKTKQCMRDAKMGKPSNNLYMQFLYRCSTIAEELGFKSHVVAPFSPISYMCNTSNEKFTAWWYNRFEFSGGFMFQAKHFHGCSGAWGVTFTLWISGGKTLNRSLPLDIKEVVKENKKEIIKTTGVKTVRWVAKEDQLSTWLKEPTKDKNRKRQILKIRKDPPQQVEAVPLTSGLSVGEREVTQSDEALGCLANNRNIKVGDCYLLSSTQNHAGTPSIDVERGESWRRAIVALAARSLPQETWINHNDGLKSPQQVEAVPLTSGLKTGENKLTRSDEAVACLANATNMVWETCCLLSSTYNYPKTKTFDLEVGEAWRRAIVALAARSLPKHAWTNDRDELHFPQGSYEQWVDDCHVAALFFPKNNMTAMRGVKYNGKTWTLHDHLFWLTREEAVAFYKEASAWKLVADARFYPTKLPNGDPYMSRLPLNLSPDAYELLVDLTALWIDSIPYREAADEDLHLTAWDAGVYQHKKLWATIPELEKRWNTLREKSRKLEDRLRDGIYKYKILVK